MKKYDRFFFLRRFCGWYLIWCAALGALWLLFDRMLNGWLADRIEAVWGRGMAAFVMAYKMQLVGGALGLGAAVIALVLLYQAAGRISLLVQAAAGLADPQRPIGDFPADLAPARMQYLEVRRTLEVRERAARAAEQRKNDLVVYLAHDLKTPLTSVVGYLSLLQDAPDLPAAQRARYTGIALEKACRLEDLIDEFFEITRFNLQSIALERGHVDLRLLLAQLGEEFYPNLQARRLTLQMELPPRLTVWADADKLSRVFDNLLRNAAAYSEPDTAVTVSAAEERGGVTVWVENRGREIPPEKLAHVFEKFYRLDSARHSATGGAGLGLAIAKEIVERHGGMIRAESTVGRTRFTVWLPAAPHTVPDVVRKP